ncbi:hypothetical protein CBS147353_11552 [Aspergillus niger]|nr:hypothetical protein CBS147353_11552 [Aspergillus niger]
MYWFSSIGGGMFSGYIQDGLHANMNGALGLASWRWVFIFDFILGIPVALFGFFCCPDEPKRNRPWWITEHEQQICIERMIEEKRDAVEIKWSIEAMEQNLTSWQLYGFVLAWG